MKNIFLAAAVLLISFGVYLYTMVPSITADDSGELAGVCATLGIAHSPGYPFYSLAGKAINTVVPFSNPAYRANLVSALFISLSAALIFAACLEISASSAASFVLSLIFAFCGIVWPMANVTEVYGTAAFFAALLAYIIAGKPSLSGIYLASFVFGIGIQAHYTLGLMAPGVLNWVFVSGKRINADFKKLLPTALLFFVAGLSIALFIYVRANANPLFSWEDPRTWKRFYQVISRMRYGTLALAQGGMPPLGIEIVAAKLVFLGKALAGGLGLPAAAVFAAGLYFALKDRLSGWAMILLFAGTGPVFILMANVGLSKSSTELLSRFLFLPVIFIIMVSAYALKRLPGKISVLLSALPLFLLISNSSALNHRDEFLFWDYTKNIVRTLPENSLLFMDRADEMEFGVAYYINALGKRSDIEFHDCNAGVTKSIYGDGYYKIWGKGRLALREIKERELIRKRTGAVYYATFDPKMINIPRVQAGLLYLAKPLNDGSRAPFAYEIIYSLRADGDSKHWDQRYQSLYSSHRQLLAEYFLSNGLWEKAEREYEGLSVYDRNRSWWGNLGYAHHSRNNLALAEKYYRKAVESGHEDAQVLINLGALMEQRGDTNSALGCYRRAIEIDSNNSQAHYNLAVLYWRRSKWADVIRELELVARLDPKNLSAAEYLTIARKRAENK